MVGCQVCAHACSREKPVPFLLLSLLSELNGEGAVRRIPQYPRKISASPRWNLALRQQLLKYTGKTLSGKDLEIGILPVPFVLNPGWIAVWERLLYFLWSCRTRGWKLCWILEPDDLGTSPSCNNYKSWGTDTCTSCFPWDIGDLERVWERSQWRWLQAFPVSWEHCSRLLIMYEIRSLIFKQQLLKYVYKPFQGNNNKWVFLLAPSALSPGW